jgi:hypothetical protein
MSDEHELPFLEKQELAMLLRCDAMATRCARTPQDVNSEKRAADRRQSVVAVREFADNHGRSAR